jgi:hypothetical protein
MLEYPIQPQNIFHKHGGKITRITGFGHYTAKPVDGRSQDTWHFLGDVQWNDSGKVQRQAEIPPWAICTDSDAGHKEISDLLNDLMEYLGEKGQWFNDSKSKHQGWYANSRSTGAFEFYHAG